MFVNTGGLSVGVTHQGYQKRSLSALVDHHAVALLGRRPQLIPVHLLIFLESHNVRQFKQDVSASTWDQFLPVLFFFLSLSSAPTCERTISLSAVPKSSYALPYLSIHYHTPHISKNHLLGQQ